MPTIRKFTDIKAWQVGRELARDVYSLTKSGPFARDFGFKDQIQRAVVSINSNIAEGFERDSNSEFVKFLGYAKGSAGEVLSQVITAHDIGYVGEENYAAISEKLSVLLVMLAKFRNRLVATDHNGLRWKPVSEQPRATETQKPRNLETQKHRNPETQKPRNIETQKRRNPET